ncbi:hypothetical protein Hanom_Chr05g00388981 [Helianthus anomalus]
MLIVLSVNQFPLTTMQKVNLLMVGEYTELLALNCYIYKFCMILNLPISHRDYRYLKHWSLTDIRFFYHINCINNFTTIFGP